MNCETIRPLLLDWAYGLLDPHEVQEIEAHSAHCDPCKKALTDAKGQKAFIRSAIVQSWPEVQFRAPEIAATTEIERKKPWTKVAAPLYFAAAILLLQLIPIGLILAGRNAFQENQIFQNLANQVETSQRQLQSKAAELRETYLAEKKRVENEYKGFPKGQLTWNPGSEKGHTTLSLSATPSALDWKAEWVQGGLTNPVENPEKSKDSQKVIVPLGSENPKLKMQWKEGETRRQIEIPLPDWITFLQLDKTHYRPGEMVRFRSVTLNRQDFSPVNSALALRFVLVGPGREWEVARGNGQLLTDSGSVLQTSQGNPIQGVGTGVFSLPEDLSLQDAWKLEVRDALNRFSPVSKPIFLTTQNENSQPLEIHFDKLAYQPGDVGIATISTLPRQEKATPAQKVILTLSFGGQNYLPDGTPTRRNRVEKELTGDGTLKLSFQIPGQVMGDKHELIAQLPGEKGFSTRVATIPLFTKTPKIKIQKDLSFSQNGRHRLVVWSSTEDGKPAPLQGLWKSAAIPSGTPLKPYFTEFPLGLYLVESSKPLGQDGSLEIQGPGPRQTLPAQTLTWEDPVSINPQERTISLQGPLPNTVDWMVLKRGRLVEKGQLLGADAGPQKIVLSAQAVEKLGGGIFQLLLQAPNDSSRVFKRSYLALGPIQNPEFDLKAGGKGQLKVHFREPSGKPMHGLALAVVYLTGSEWGQAGHEVKILPWQCEAQAEGLTLSPSLVEWIQRIPEGQIPGFLNQWFSAQWENQVGKPPETGGGPTTGPRVLADPFRAPFVEQLKSVSQNLDGQWEKAQKDHKELMQEWAGFRTAIKRNQDEIHFWKTVSLGLWSIPLLGFAGLLFFGKDLTRQQTWALVLISVLPSFASMSYCHQGALLATDLGREGNPSQDQEGTKLEISPLGTKPSAPAGFNAPQKQAELPSGPSQAPSKALSWDIPMKVSRQPQIAVPGDHLESWPKPRFLESEEGTNDPEMGSLPMKTVRFERASLPLVFPKGKLILWDPSFVLSEEGTLLPELKLEPSENARLFLFGVSSQGGIGFADVCLPGP